MSDRPAPASHRLHGSASAFTPTRHAAMARHQRGPYPTGSAVPPLPRGPLYPDIPRQWTGPTHESLPPQWAGPPPAGLDAPMPVPRTHPVRNAVLGITGFLAVLVVLGGLVSVIGLAPPADPGSTSIGAWQDNGGLDRVKALLNDLEAAQDAGRAADLAGMDRACSALHADAEAAQAYHPIPDREAQAHWAATLTHLTHASATCVTAIRTRDAELFAQATNEMGEVPADVSAVVNRLLTLNPR